MPPKTTEQFPMEETEDLNLRTGFLDPLIESLKKIELPPLNKNINESFIELVRKAESPIQLISDYFALVELQREISNVLSGVKIQVLEMPKQPQKSEEYHEALENITAFKNVINDTITKNFSKLVQYLLADKAALRNALFCGIELTEKNIITIYKKLSLVCHPDKCAGHPKQAIFEEFFKILVEEKDQLLLKLKEDRNGKNEVEYHKKNGDDYWKLVLDWQNAEKGEYGNLKILRQQEIENKTPTEKKQFKINAAKAAFQQYRAACYIIDSELFKNQQKLDEGLKKFLEQEQILLRRYMALMLYVAGCHLDAQIYAIGAIQLLLRRSWCTQEDLDKVNEILDKINKKQEEQEKENTKAASQESPLVQDIVPVVVKPLVLFKEKMNPLSSISGRKERKQQAEAALSKIMIEYLVKPEARIATYVTPKELIVHAEQKAYSYRHTGSMTQIAGSSIAVTSALSGGIAIANIASIIGGGATVSSIGGPVGTAVGALVGFFVGVIGMYFGWQIFKKGTELRNEPVIRKELNEIINKAVEAYQSGDPLKCITLLAKPYGTELQTLITFSNENEETASISIKAADLRNTLLRHGFHPDGVGFLLVMLGEILASGQLKLKQTAVSSQLDQSKDLFLCAAERLPEQLQCSLHIMPVLPKNLKQYKNCYILIEANQKLYYIYAPYEAGETSEKDQMLVLFEEEVKIADYSKFENVLNSLRAGKKNVSLLDNQIAELITSNGGHVPTIKPLMRKALKLDETIRIWRPRSNQTILNKFRRFVIVEYNGVPDEYLDRCLKESNEAPYVGRLREIQLVAQLNSALVQMIIGRDDNLDLARDYIVKMYEAIHYNYHYFVPIEVRLLTLEDFLSALGYDPEFKLKKDTFQQYAVLEHMPRRIFNEDGQAKSVISFITQLNQPIDILNIICTLSDGVLNISYETFKNKLENNRTILNCNLLLEELEKKVNLDCWLLKSEYLPVLSQLFKIKFELYKSIVENNACRYIPLVEQPVAPEQPKVTICLVVDEQKYYEDKKNLPKLLFVFQKEAELIDITQRIDSASTEAELSAAYLAKAHFYYKTAAQIKSHARSLIQYEAALESYERALQFRIKSNEPNKEACWGVIKCQLMLGQVNQCLSFLNQRAQEFVYYEKFWYYKAQVLRRLQKYVESNTFIQKALEINSQNTAFDDERKKIQKLQKTNEIMEIYKTTHLQNDEQYYKTRQQMKMEELPNYNILSMDGGGIRGIIPAVVLSEIERQIGRPIAHNFDLCAGTSTGGLISLLLTVPDKHNATCPKYRASDILQLYTTRGKDIFTTDHRNWIERNVLQNILNLASSKYSATGRNNLCDEYFEKYKLADCLTEVVIPATLQRRPNITNFFSRYEAKKNPNDLRYNPTMKDAGMATSAAPTYFPEHKIVVGYQKKTCQSVTNAVITVDVPIEEIYSDGGIQCNNPAALAYDFSLKQAIEPEKIKIWSIGTGDCIRSSFNQSAYQGQYFWAKNLQHFLGAQQNDVDTYLDTSLGDRYHRFQFWMDHEQIIPLDDFRPETVEYLLNAGHEVVEENADKINKLVEDAKNRFEL